MKMYISVIVNFIILLFVFFCLVYANTYLNEHIVPDNLLWENNQPRLDKVAIIGVASIKTLVLLLEGAIFILILYFINRLMINDQVILMRILKINLIITIVFVLILIWGSFRGYLW